MHSGNTRYDITPASIKQLPIIYREANQSIVSYRTRSLISCAAHPKPSPCSLRSPLFSPQVLEDNIKATIKPQYVDHIPRAVRGQVGKVLKAKDERTEAEGFDALEWAVENAELGHVMDRDIGVLSGGELQRFAIAAVAVQSSDVYMFDEPSSYLDVKQVRMGQKCVAAAAPLHHSNPVSLLASLAAPYCCLHD